MEIKLSIQQNKLDNTYAKTYKMEVTILKRKCKPSRKPPRCRRFVQRIGCVLNDLCFKLQERKSHGNFASMVDENEGEILFYRKMSEMDG